MMNNTEKLIVSNFEDRFTQIKGISDYIKRISSTNLDIIKKVKEAEDKDISKFNADMVTFKKNEMSMSLLHQQLQSLVSRAVEYFTIIKIADLPISLSEEDLKFFEEFTKQKLDLFGIEKGELIILNKEFHNAVMDNISKMNDGEVDKIFEYMKAVK